VVTEAEWPEIIKATGPISTWQEAVIGAEISGRPTLVMSLKEAKFWQG
jgi:hypothetical protein